MSADLEARVAALKQRFATELHRRLEELGEALAEARACPEVEPLRAAYHIAHKICGSAGTFGYDGVGFGAETIEQALSTCIEANSHPSDDAWAVMDRALERALGELGG